MDDNAGGVTLIVADKGTLANWTGSQQEWFVVHCYVLRTQEKGGRVVNNNRPPLTSNFFPSYSLKVDLMRPQLSVSTAVQISGSKPSRT